MMVVFFLCLAIASLSLSAAFSLGKTSPTARYTLPSTPFVHNANTPINANSEWVAPTHRERVTPIAWRPNRLLYVALRSSAASHASPSAMDLRHAQQLRHQTQDDRQSALVACLKNITGSSDSELRNARYGSRAQPIVGGIFTYRPRTAQEQQVADWLRSRYKERAALGQEKTADKFFNPLIAVTGAPGMGKSSFLAHLPDSVAFQRYHQLTGAAAPPIVSALTFFSGMRTNERDEDHDLGLRVLYGAYRSMDGPLPKQDWRTFRRTISNVHPECIDASDAVVTLREVYGPERRVLLLIDEVSKAALHGKSGWDERVLQELGGVLDERSWVDVVVSSLSAPYIAKLVTSNSQRRVQYLPLPLLLDEMEGTHRLGEEEARDCADAVFEAAKVKASSSSWAYRLLCNLPLLTSGHPRSLQYLVKAQELVENNSNGTMQLPVCWNEVVKDVSNAAEAGGVLLTVAREVIHTRCEHKLKKAFYPQVLPLVLSCCEIDPIELDEESNLVRELVESGQIFLVPSDGDDKFHAVIRSDNFIQLARWAQEQQRPDEYARALAMLLGEDVVELEKAREKANENVVVEVKKEGESTADKDVRDYLSFNNITVLWERVAALTVVGRSLKNAGSVLGKGVREFKMTSALSVTIAQTKNDLHKLLPNTLTITPPDYPGSDSQAMFCHESSSSSGASLIKHVAYLQYKITIALKKRKLERIVAKTVVYSLRDHLQRPCTRNVPLENVRMVLYAWTALPPLDVELLSTEVDKLLKNARKKNKPPRKPGELSSMSKKAYEKLCSEAKHFVTDYLPNIAVMDKAKLDGWLIPSLRPIPRVVEATVSKK